MTSSQISSEFPFDSKYIDVHGSKIHFIERGEGDPILFIHGNPTSSYLWRNIIPHVEENGRCIAVDLIGMGRSEIPDIKYRFFDHVKYLEGFIECLGLKNMTLVLHDWGGGLGFHYAKRHEENIKGICFMEAVTRPLCWKDLGFIDRWVLRRFRHPEKSEKLLVKRNEFVEKVLPRFILRKLSEEEMNNYRSPFVKESHRKVVAKWPGEIPINGQPADVNEAIKENYEWLVSTHIPKLVLWSKPGAIMTEPYIRYLADELTNTTVKYVGKGRHYIQEDTPDQIGKELSTWHRETQAH